MFPEYLYNNDTQEIGRRVSELAEADEPALRAQCQEVSRQTDTSSLCLQKDYVTQVNATNAVLAIIAKNLQELSQSLLENASVFRTRDGKGDFPTVCRAVTRIEEERLHLLSCITALTQTRRAIASNVAQANRTLHFLSLAMRAVPLDVRAQYEEMLESTKTSYVRLTELDVVLRQAQDFYMTMVESHLPAFMERLRTAADFNHAGEALDKSAIRTLCSELQILLSRTPNVSF